ncbi:MAG: hypothetical protein LBH32_01035 [Dysgonamonadaceae bacterium]|jgi:hypothetical protein|nr:hypothetical protein [Dysgonamonadaceae bacterium]
MKQVFIKYRLLWFWLIGCLIIVLRRTDALFYPQFWSEDGFEFFYEAFKSGWSSFITPYAGYLHIIPRSITYLAFFISENSAGIALMPLIMNICAIAINSICAVAVCSDRFKWLGSIYLRMTLGFFILLFPDCHEVLGNVTNIHWWLGALTFLLLWDLIRNRKMPDWTDTVILSLVVLTTPNGLLILPVILVCYWLKHRFRLTFDALKILPVFIFFSIQLFLMLESRVPKDKDLIMLIYNAVDYVFVQLFAHLIFGQLLNQTGLFITGILFFVFFCFLAAKLFKSLYFPVIFLFLLTGLYVFGAEVAEPAYRYGRYIFLPVIIIFLVLLLGFVYFLQQKRSAFKVLNISVLCIIFLFMSFRIIRNYKTPDFERFPWKEEASLYASDGKSFFHFPINNDYWTVSIPTSQDRGTYLSGYDMFSIDADTLRGAQNFRIKNSSENTSRIYNPGISYQLPDAMFIDYCCIDFESFFGVKRIRLCFFEDENAGASIVFNVENENLIQVNSRMSALKTKFIRIDFLEKSALDNPLIIKSITYYSRQ